MLVFTEPIWRERVSLRAPFDETEVVRQRRQDRGGHGDPLGERPDAHPRLRDEPEHATAAGGLAGKVPALDLWEVAGAASRRERTIDSAAVPRPKGRRADGYQLLAGVGTRI